MTIAQLFAFPLDSKIAGRDASPVGNTAILVFVVITALGFDFTNGFHDTGNAMATSIATGALRRGSRSRCRACSTSSGRSCR